MTALRPAPADLLPRGGARAGASEPHVFTVEELALYIQSLLEADPVLLDVWLSGEVSNLSRSPAGHYYFCLKDEVAQLKCVLFRGNAARSSVLPSSGQALVAHGSIRFYARQGACELLVDLLFPQGVGLAQMQFEALYRRLEAEGLFDASRKRPLPAFPRRIGILTSEGGAVIHDLLTVLRRRYPLGEVVFQATPVQGEAAAAAIATGMGALNGWRAADGGGVDVIVVARGGGSAEDLACFNDERVVRAIFGSRAPVVSAVGHETDVTLADLVADLRAPTPSAAAEMIAPDVETLRREVQAARVRGAVSVRSLLVQARRECDVLRERVAGQVNQRLRLARERLAGRSGKLAALSPAATLARGYAVAEINGALLLDAASAQVGQQLSVRLRRGRVDGTVTAVQPT